jgi:tripartite-type tricarboxylate transporter receptor subunit TctC
MQESLKQPIVVDNRPGASGQLAVGALLQWPADGYTIMAAENATLMFNEHLFAKLPYKKDRDFSYIGAIGHVPLVLVVNPKFGAQTLAEFVSYAKAHPGAVNFASAGNTSIHRIAMEMFKRAAEIDITHVAYKGGLPAVQDVISGQVESMMFDLTNGIQNIRAGQVRPLAVAAPKRIPSIPDVPTFAELGYKQVIATTLHGVIGRTGMPAAAVARFNQELNKALHDPRARQLFTDSALEIAPGTPADFQKAVRVEGARWAEIIRAAGIKGD